MLTVVVGERSSPGLERMLAWLENGSSDCSPSGLERVLALWKPA